MPEKQPPVPWVPPWHTFGRKPRLLVPVPEPAASPKALGCASRPWRPRFAAQSRPRPSKSPVRSRSGQQSCAQASSTEIQRAASRESRALEKKRHRAVSRLPAVVRDPYTHQ